MLNNVIICGRVGKKPELKKTNNNISWVKFSLATEERWKDKTTGEKKSRTDWHNVKAWRGLAENICSWVVQGQYLEIRGTLRCDMVETKDAAGNVVKRDYYHYVQADKVEFMQKPKAYWDAQNNGQSAPVNKPAAAAGQPTVAQLQAQLMELQKMVASLGGQVAPTSSAPPMDTEDDGGPPPDEYEQQYNTQPYQAPQAPAQQQTLVAGL